MALAQRKYLRLLVLLLLALVMMPSVSQSSQGKNSLNLFRNLRFKPGSRPMKMHNIYKLLSQRKSSKLMMKVLIRNSIKSSKIFRSQIDNIRFSNSSKVDIIFVLDGSDSIGSTVFAQEIDFMRSIMKNFLVVHFATRVAVISVTPDRNTRVQVDQISNVSEENHQCSFMLEDLTTIEYSGGGTYTTGALEQAREIFLSGRSRSEVKRVIFVMTDGYSNSGNPRNAAQELRDIGAEVFCIGTYSGHVKEHLLLASNPPLQHTFLVKSGSYISQLDIDLPAGNWTNIYAGSSASKCDSCKKETCCHPTAECKCDVENVQYECICRPGHYQDSDGMCHKCLEGTYQLYGSSGQRETCVPCPVHMESPLGSTHIKVVILLLLLFY